MYYFPAQAVADYHASLTDQMKEDLNSQNVDKQIDVIKKSLSDKFDLTYITKVIIPALQQTTIDGERIPLPLLDVDKLDKQNALPYFLWGLLYDNYEPPTPEQQSEKGTTVFLRGYRTRGPENLKKRIYFTALTSNLYKPKYQHKVKGFFDDFLSAKNEGKPLMSIYMDHIWNLYWDLHVGQGKDLPSFTTDIAVAFNTVLATIIPFNPEFVKNYMLVRKLRKPLDEWLDAKIEEIESGRVENADETYVYYWLKNNNGPRNEYFLKNDIIFECFHNFLAFSQYGNSIYMMMQEFSGSSDRNKAVQAWFKKIMHMDYDKPIDGSPFSPLDLFTMELFRVLSPNGFSMSTVEANNVFSKHFLNTTPHPGTSDYYMHWTDAEKFNPDRYLDVPTSVEVDKKKSEEIGFAQCPFSKTQIKSYGTPDEKTEITNSAFGTVFGVTDGNPSPVCDYAGYAPFGFGYRRCPGELFTIEVFKDFLRKVWNDGIKFEVLDIKNPEEIPVAPNKFVPDNIGFTRS